MAGNGYMNGICIYTYICIYIYTHILLYINIRRQYFISWDYFWQIDERLSLYMGIMEKYIKKSWDMHKNWDSFEDSGQRNSLT